MKAILFLGTVSLYAILLLISLAGVALAVA